MSLSKELDRISACIDTCKNIFSNIENVDVDQLSDEDLSKYRILTQDLASITTHSIESLAALQREIRALKQRAFSLRKGETKESMVKLMDDLTIRLNAMT